MTTIEERPSESTVALFASAVVALQLFRVIFILEGARSTTVNAFCISDRRNDPMILAELDGAILILQWAGHEFGCWRYRPNAPRGFFEL